MDEKNENGKLLMRCNDSIQADIIESLLKSYEIPVLRKSLDIGGIMEIYTGVNEYGEDLYVPSDLYEKAREVVQASTEVSDIPDAKADEDFTDEDYDKADSNRTKLRYIFLVIILLAILLPSLASYLKSVLG